MANTNLSEAKNAKNDEFYTQYADIQKEVNAYIEYNPDVFRGKTILLPCDDPEWSNFTKFFAQNFENYGIKKLISTSYAYDKKRIKGPYQLSFFEEMSPQFDKRKTKSHGKIFTLTRDSNNSGRIDIDDLEYKIILSDETSEEANKILSGNFKNEYLYSHINIPQLWYRKYGSFGGNKIELENFILGLKYQFFEMIGKCVPTFFLDNGIIPPHLIVVDSKGTPKDELLKLFSFDSGKNKDEQMNHGDFDYKDGIFCNIGFTSYTKSHMHDYAIIFDSSVNSKYQYYAMNLEGYHVQLGKIIVAEVITEEIDKLIVKEQTRINKTLERRSLTTQSMLKTRLKAYQNIYLFRRLEKALLESLKSDNGMHGALKGFQNDYRSLRPDVLQDENGILYHRRILVYKMERQLINIDSLFEVFDVKLKLFESSSNIRLIRWTFILTIVSIIVALLALLDSAGIVDLTGLWSLTFKQQ